MAGADRGGRTRGRALTIAAVLAAVLAAIFAAPTSAAADLPPGAEAVLALLRSAPDDPDRLEAVARWAEERDGVASLAAALLARGRARSDALDLSLAGSLYENAGRPDEAIAPHEAALAISPALERSRRALIELWLRGGWGERAAELARELPGGADGLPVALALRLAATGALGGEEGARRRLEGLSLDAPTRVQLARDAGLLSLAAALAEESGDLATALELRVAAGETARAEELRTRGAVPSPAAGLAHARLTGDRALLDAALAARADPAAEELRAALALSFGERRVEGAPAAADAPGAPAAGAPASPGGSAGSGGAPPAADPRHDAAIAILSGGDPESARAALAAEGPPSFAVAAAWLAAGESPRARRETARARLAARPGEDRWRAWLARQRPEWFGAEIDPAALVDRLEEIGAGSEIDRASIDRAILAAPPGSDAEAALLFHRHRLHADPRDLARAAAIAPATIVEWPLAAGIRAAMPLAPAARTALDPRSAIAAPIALPEPIDRAIGETTGRDGRRTLRVGSRPPSRSDWRLAEWRELDGEDPDDRLAPPAGFGVPLASPAAPTTAWLDLGAAGRLLVGRGIELRAADGALVAAWVTPLPLDLAGVPALAAHLPAPLLAYLDELRAEPVALADVPALAETWRGIVLREALDPAARPDLVRESAGRLLLRGGGIRAELVPGEAAPPENPGSTPAGSDTPSARARRTAPSAPPPAAPLALVRSRLAEPARAGREQVHPFFPDEPLGAWTSRAKLAPEQIRLVHAGELSLLVDRSGRLEGGDRGASRWRAFLPPPLPGPLGWRLDREDTERESAARGGRRGPDLTGPTSDGGLLRIHRLAEDRLALASDRVVLCDLDGLLPAPAGPAGGTFARIRDVTENRSGVWVLAAPGDRLAGERALVALGREGGFDCEGCGDAVWVLGYDPVAVALWLLRVAPDGVTEVELPAGIPVEEDRARLRPVALGRWGERLLIAAHGRVWIERAEGSGDERWLELLPRGPTRRLLPPAAWQTPPRVAGDRLIVAWPWGEVEEARAP